MVNLNGRREIFVVVDYDDGFIHNILVSLIKVWFD